MLGFSPIGRLRAQLSARRAFLSAAALAALGAACTEGRLPTQGHGLVPMPIGLTINAQVSSAGRAMKVVARYAKQDTLQLVTFDSAVVTLTGTETQLPIKLDIAACLAAPDRERPEGMSADLAATVCMLRLRVTLLDETGGVIDETSLPPLVARPGEQAQAPPISLGIPIGSVVLGADTVTINALTHTRTLTAIVRDRAGTVLSTPSLSFTSLDPAVATVDTLGGRVTAIGVGTARIVATSRDKADTALVNVRQVPSSVGVTTTATSLFVGDSLRLVTSAQDSAGVTIPATAVQLSVSDTMVARLAPATWVVGRSPGSVTVTGTAGPASASLALTVVNVPVGSISLSPSPDTIGVGLSSRLTATLTGTTGAPVTGRPIAWSSSDTNVVRVDSTGTVFGVNVGSASVTATSEGKSGSVPVIVETALFCPDGRPRASTTLRAAILRAPVNGTVLVCDGVHPVDTARIDKPLTLRSQNPGQAIIESADQNVTAIQTGRPSVYVAGIPSGTVRIADIGFRMKGRGLWLGEWPQNPAGVYDQVRIDSVRFAGVDTLYSIALTVGTSAATSPHVDLTNSTLENFSIGAFLISPVETFIRGSLFQNFAGGGVIFSGTYAQGRVEDNVFRNCGSRNCVRGLNIGPYAVIARNRFEVPTGSAKLAAILAQRALTTPARNPIIIEDNEIIGAATGTDPLQNTGWTMQSGIFVNDSVGVTNVVRRNRISGVYEGVNLRADVDMRDNTVTGSGYAFNASLSTNATIQRNDFTSNAASFKGVNSASSYQCNWWGSTNGPAAPPADVSSAMYLPAASEPIANRPTVVCTPQTPSGTRIWTGALSMDWSNPGNWSPAQAPTIGDTAVVNAGGTQPVLATYDTVAKLVLGSGATLSSPSGYTLYLTSGLVTAGTFTGPGYLQVMNGPVQLAGTLSNLWLRGQSSAVLTGALTMTGTLDVADSSSITLSGRRLATPTLSVTESAQLTMTNAADTLDVSGGMSLYSTAPHAGRFTAGLLRARGNFSTNTNVNLGTVGTTLLFDGTTDQYVYFYGADTLQNVVLANSGTGTYGVYFYTAGVGTRIGGVLTLQSGRAHLAGQTEFLGRLVTAAGTTLAGSDMTLRDSSGTNGIAGTLAVATVRLGAAGGSIALKPGLTYQNVYLERQSAVQLAGPVTLAGSLVVDDTTSLSLAGRRLAVGSLSVTDRATVTMTNAADTLDVAGGTTLYSTAPHAGRFTAGLLRTRGNFSTNTNVNLGTVGTTMLFDGATDQYVYFYGADTLQNVVLANSSTGSYGVYFYTAGVATRVGDLLTLQSGKAQLAGQTHFLGRLVTAAGTTLAGNDMTLRDSSGTNGIAGTLAVSTVRLAAGGPIALKPALTYQNVAVEGRSEVTLTGPVTLAGSLMVDDTTTFTLDGRHLSTGMLSVSDRATLVMTNAADTLDVSGSTTIYTTAPLSGKLTAGVMRFAGGFSTNTNVSFVSTGTRLEFNGGGTADQYVYFYGDTLQDVVLANTGSGTYGIYLYGGTSTFNGALTQTTGRSTVVSNLLANGPVALQGGTMTLLASLDLNGSQLTTSPGTTLDGGGSLTLRDSLGTSGIGGAFGVQNLFLTTGPRQPVSLKPGLGYKNVTVNGGAAIALSGPVTTQSLTLNDSTALTLDGRRITATGLQVNNVATVTMTNPADTLEVSGPTTFYTTAPHNGRLTAGVMRYAGGFSTNTNVSFVSTGTRLEFNGGGTADQYVYFYGDTLQDVVLANSGTGTYGVYLYGGTSTINGALTQTAGRSTIVSNLLTNGAVSLQGGTMSLQAALDVAASQLTTAPGTTLEGSGTLTLRDSSGTSGIGGTFTLQNLVLATGPRQAVVLKPGLGYKNLTLSGGADVTLSGALATQNLLLNDSTALTLNGRRVQATGLGVSNVATFTMTNPADTLEVAGPTTFYTTAPHNGRLTAGVMRYAGGFSTNTNVSFVSTGTRLEFNGGGTADQYVYFYGDTLQDVVLANTGTGTYGVYLYGATTTINGALTQASGKSTVVSNFIANGPVDLQQGSMSLLASLDVVGGPFSTGSGTTLSGTGTLTLSDTSGTAGVNGAFSVTNLVYQLPYGSYMRLKPDLAYGNVSMYGKGQVRLSAPTTLTGTMTANDTVLVAFDGRRLTVSALQVNNAAVIEMVNAGDTLDVTGTTTFSGSGNLNGRLTNGIMRLGGSLTTNGANFVSTGTNIVANGVGTADQYFNLSGSTLNNLTLANAGTGTYGVYLYPGAMTLSGTLEVAQGSVYNSGSLTALNILFASGTKVNNPGTMQYYQSYISTGATVTGNPPTQVPQ